MFRLINDRIARIREHREDGAALLSAVILSLFVFIVIASLAATTVTAVRTTASSKVALKVIGSAESGVDDAIVAASKGECVASVTSTEFNYSYQVYRSAGETAPTGLDDPELSAGCPVHGDTFITVESTGTDASGKETTVVATYQWVNVNPGSIAGAVVSASGDEKPFYQYNLDGPGADVVFRDGNFNCTGPSSVSGDLIILDGNVSLSGGCVIWGTIYANGNVELTNPGVVVHGDIYATGNYSQTMSTTVDGDVYVGGNAYISSGGTMNGNLTIMGNSNHQLDNVDVHGDVRVNGLLTLNNTTEIWGNVVSTSTGDFQIYNSTIHGDLVVNGRFTQLQLSRIYGDVVSVRSGVTSTLDQSLTVDGSLYFGGSIVYNGGVPANVGGTINQNQTLIAAPLVSFDMPPQTDPDNYPWIDYDFVDSEWLGAGYQIVTTPTCDLQNNASARNQIMAYTTPTVIDFRGCGNVSAYGITLNIQTDITFLMNGFSNGQNIKVNSSSPGTPHRFDIFTPDSTPDESPTCSGGKSVLSIYAIKFSSDISSFIYSPCRVFYGGDSRIYGQLIAGQTDFNSGAPFNFYFVSATPPGFPSPETEVTVSYDDTATSRIPPRMVSRIES